MEKGYWVARVDVSDPEKFKVYSDFVGPFVAAHGGRFVVRGGTQQRREGSERQRTMIVEWPSYEAARNAYDSSAYKVGLDLREGIATVDFVIVEGVAD